MKIVYLYNQLGAGPLMISSLLANKLNGSDDLVLINNRIRVENKNKNIFTFPTSDNFMLRMLFRLLLELVIIPILAIYHRKSKLLAFGNFNLIPYPLTKRILIHHPYLVDDVALGSQSFKVKLLERMKRLYFYIQVMLFPNNMYFAQTQHFLSALESKFKGIKVSLLPNPLTNKISFPDDERFESILNDRVDNYEKLKLLYVSRYYPHKNHQFIVNLAKAIERKGLNVELLITVDESRIPEDLKENIHNLSSLKNIGEIEQEMLSSYYLNSHFCIFPSITETFGNGLIEATKFGLPTLALDYPYVDDVLGRSALKVDSVESCITVLESFVGDSFYYHKISKSVFDYSRKFISVDEWVEALSK